jgi:hypothetical protein
LKIFFVDAEYKALWKNSGKKAEMYWVRPLKTVVYYFFLSDILNEHLTFTSYLTRWKNDWKRYW